MMLHHITCRRKHASSQDGACFPWGTVPLTVHYNIVISYYKDITHLNVHIYEPFTSNMIARCMFVQF